MKAIGGLTPGRGMYEAQRTQRLLSMSVCADVNAIVQELTGASYTSREQQCSTKV